MVSNCGDAVMANAISVPGSGSPALELYWKATPGVNVPLQLDVAVDPAESRILTMLVGTGAGATTRWCLPNAVRGRVVTLRAQMPSVNGGCGGLVNHELVLDNVHIVDDPACAADPALPDSDFESGHPPAGAAYNPPRSVIATVIDAALAHTGMGVLRFQGNHGCEYASFEARAIVPPPVAGAGPVLRFFYNVPSNPNSDLRARDYTANGFYLDEGVGWKEGKVCLDPDFADRPLSVYFDLITTGACATSFTPESGFIDDLVVGYDAACPSD
jgi:hypothetical protein